MFSTHYPTPDKAFCATAQPSSIAHLVGRMGTCMRARRCRNEERRGRDVHAAQCWATTARDQPLCATQPTGMRMVPRVRMLEFQTRFGFNEASLPN
ncbi:hypothetical protein PR002_g12885 [Phytophthora rubi]|uniref:Uncharacterized protein n=1 Tax=Phytophthora rubi TaxID=129364 RepID=A0A6A3LTN9_9STRA|nr:hypothetical protein PR002_g12885 [Phytophthora rubi]